MTEIERIINKGIIPKGFLEPETKCDFLIDEKRKKIWTVLLDLLYEFDKVCNKYGLRYYACGGTVLGAERHKGFIPWDDDLDVYMFRDEYNELIKHADEFSNPYFLQTPYTDPGCFISYVKIRNSNTSLVSDVFAWGNWNMGIYLDVFPMDEFILDELQENYDKIDSLAMENGTYMRMNHPCLDERNKQRVANYSGRNPYETYEEIQRIATQYAGDERTDCYVEMVCTEYRDSSRKIIKKDEITSQVFLDFECLKIPTFNGYKNHLTRMYGDYMQLPPLEERYAVLPKTFDPDTPYKETVMRKRNVIK